MKNFTLGVTRACVCVRVFMNESGFAFCMCMSDYTCVITCVNYTFVGLHLSLNIGAKEFMNKYIVLVHLLFEHTRMGVCMLEQPNSTVVSAYKYDWLHSTRAPRVYLCHNNYY